MYDIHTCTRNFRKFCTPVARIPWVRVQHVLYPLGTSVSSVFACATIPGTSGSSVRHPHVPAPGTTGSSVISSYPYYLILCDYCKTVAKYPGFRYTFVTIPWEFWINSGLSPKVYNALIRMSPCLPVTETEHRTQQAVRITQ